MESIIHNYKPVDMINQTLIISSMTHRNKIYREPIKTQSLDLYYCCHTTMWKNYLVSPYECSSAHIKERL